MPEDNLNNSNLNENNEIQRQMVQTYINDFGGKIDKLKKAYQALLSAPASSDTQNEFETNINDILGTAGSYGLIEISEYSSIIIKVLAQIKASKLSYNQKVFELLWQAVKYYEVIQMQAKRGKIVLDYTNSVVAKLNTFERDIMYYQDNTLNQKKILAVDDDPDILRLLEIVLKRAGFNVITAKSGFDALSYLQTDMPEIMLLDIAMPGMNGFEVLAKIKSDEKLKAIPVIMVTAHNQKEEIVKAVQSGAQNYVVKPFDSKELIARIKKTIGE